MKMKRFLFPTLLLLFFNVVSLKNYGTYYSVKAEGERSSVETMCLQQIVNQTIGQTKLKNVTSWFNLDDSDDYLYVEFETGGYAVFFKENMEMLEYSPTKGFPTSNEKIYYCGPNNVFVKNDKCFKNVLTNETVLLKKIPLQKELITLENIFQRVQRRNRR